MNVLKKAYSYITDNGYSVIPIKPGEKTPAIDSWLPYKDNIPDPFEAAEWWKDTNNNIAIVTGLVSDLTVVDIDRSKPDGKETPLDAFPETFTVRTPSGGYHLYYKYSPKIGQSANKYPQFPHTDIRNDGGYVVAPPSKSKKGEYKVINDMEVRPFPSHLFKGVAKKNQFRQGLSTVSYLDKIDEGGRNEAITSIANNIFKVLPQDKWSIGVTVVQASNTLLAKPLPEKEMSRTIESMMKRHSPSKVIKWHIDQKGNPYPTAENIYITLQSDNSFKGKFRYNTFNGQVETSFDNDKWETLLRHGVTSVLIGIQEEYPFFNSVARGHVEESIVRIAHSNPVSPVADYIKKLEWDKKPRIDRWITEVYKVEDNNYHSEIGSNWIKAMVKRIIIPGTQVDNTLVVDGGQGIGKSRSFRALCAFPDLGDLFHETSETPNNKDFLISLLGNLVVEFSEGSIMSHVDQKKIKAFLTKTSDKYRPPYEKADVEFQRQCVFAMTTNESQFLKDTTGNRRWWPVSIPRHKKIEINVEWLNQNRDQMMAEAYARIKEPHWELSEEATLYLEDVQEQKTQEDPRAEILLNWYVHDLTEEQRERGITTSMGLEKIPSDIGSRSTAWLESKIIAEIYTDKLKLEYKKVTTMAGTRVMRYVPTEDTPKESGVIDPLDNF